jgi:hypothetical protein
MLLIALGRVKANRKKPQSALYFWGLHEVVVLSPRWLISSLTLPLLLIAGWRAYAQDEQTSLYRAVRASAFIVSQPIGKERDLSFQPVLSTALRIELERAGLEAGVPQEPELAPLAWATVEALQELARGAGADFLFVVGYIKEGQDLRIAIAAYGVEEGERMASVRAKGRIGLRLDEAVTQAAKKLLPQLEASIASALQRRRKALAAQPPVEVALAEQAQPAGEPQEGLQTEAPAEPAVPETSPSVEPEPVEAAQPQPSSAGALPPQPPAVAEAPPQRPLAWEAAAGAAPFFPMLALSDVFKLGIMGTLYLERILNTSIGTLGLGLYAGYTGFVPVDVNRAAYFKSLIPVGLELRWTAFERSRLGLFVRIVGGAAVNVSDQSKVAGRLTRVLPQLKAGTGLTVAFSRRIGISVEFLYEMLFYLYMVNGRVANDLIMGFDAPAICVYTKW